MRRFWQSHMAKVLFVVAALVLGSFPVGQRPQAQGALPDKFLFAIGAQAPVGQFLYPSGIAVAPDGSVYVADTDGDRVQAFGTSYPSTWRAECWRNRCLTGAAVLIRQDMVLDSSCDEGSPGPGVPADQLSARWSRYVWLESGRYQFTVSVDDGVRLWVSNDLLIPHWREQVATFSATAQLAQATTVSSWWRWWTSSRCTAQVSGQRLLLLVRLAMLTELYPRVCGPLKPIALRVLCCLQRCWAGVMSACAAQPGAKTTFSHTKCSRKRSATGSWRLCSRSFGVQV